MKTLKRLLALTMAVMMLSAFSINALAADISTESMPGEVEPQYISTCEGGGKHQMVGKGITVLYYHHDGISEILLGGGFVSQCTVCYLALISENWAFRYTPWGIYTTKTYSYPIGSTNARIDCDSYSVCTDMNTPYYEGFEFLLPGKSLEE